MIPPDQKADDCCVTRSGHNIAVTARTALRERPFAGQISQARPQLGRSRRVSDTAAYRTGALKMSGAERHDMHRRAMLRGSANHSAMKQ